MFAGDIGSISIAYLMIYFLVQWYLVGHSWTIILLLMMYGLDVILTMARRIKDRENITLPHRTHLYQLLVNQTRFDHVTIALAYALIQAGINFALFVFPQSSPDSALSLGVALVGTLIYLIVKFRLQHLNLEKK